MHKYWQGANYINGITGPSPGLYTDLQIVALYLIIFNAQCLTFNDKMFDVGRDPGRSSEKEKNKTTLHLAVCWGGVGSAVNNGTLINSDLAAGVWLTSRASGLACMRPWAPS